MEFITSDGEKVFYEVSGSGVPAVYIHGGPGYWSKSFQYSMHNLLENQLRMIYVDQRGCGRSEECSNTDFSLNRITDDFEELRDHLGLQDWYLIAHSFGGILALNYAKKYPNRVKGIILSNATLNMVNSFEYQIRYSRKLLGLKKQQLHTGNKESLLNTYYTTISKLAEHNLHNQLQFKDPCNKQILDEIDKDLFFGKSFQQYVFNTGEYFYDFTTNTRSIEQPVLVISGGHDYAVDPNHHEQFKFCNAALKVLDSGHHPYVEKQREFSEIILDFVSES